MSRQFLLFKAIDFLHPFRRYAIICIFAWHILKCTKMNQHYLNWRFFWKVAIGINLCLLHTIFFFLTLDWQYECFAMHERKQFGLWTLLKTHLQLVHVDYQRWGGGSAAAALWRGQNCWLSVARRNYLIIQTDVGWHAHEDIIHKLFAICCFFCN